MLFFQPSRKSKLLQRGSLHNPHNFTVVIIGSSGWFNGGGSRGAEGDAYENIFQFVCVCPKVLQ